MAAGPAINSHANKATIIAFDILVVLSTIFGLLVVSTVFFSPKLYRRPTWYSAVIPCCFYSAAFFLLIGQQHTDTPAFGICAFQAILIYALPSHCTMAVACFALDFYSTLKGISFEGRLERPSPRRITLLLLAPFAALFINILASTVVLAQDKSVLESQLHLYCHIRVETPSIVSAITTLSAFLLLSTVLIRAGLLLRRHYSGLKNMSTLRREVVSLYARIAVFSVGIFAGMILGILGIIHVDSLSIASIFSYLVAPTVIFISLGTQGDIVERWLFWRGLPMRPRNASLVVNGKGDPRSLDLGN